ncbi:MAG TPA: tRNA preQ1(34) S-adenosylmethionine ribosyltransferase-isomerase QueA [Candidatus Brocadiia bacterium]|nr:tRNA preQ1(34) S-adenosylmethionine ribosyltransferase-isomerase QueA [Candidatus Brocadiia bacterium]
MSDTTRLESYYYELPEERIAQCPAERRDASRLLVIDRKSGTLEHHVFSEIVNFLGEGDCLVLNQTRVIRARLIGRRHTGARVEALLIRDGDEPDTSWAMLKPSTRLKVGEKIEFEGGALTGELLPRNAAGEWFVRWIAPSPSREVIERVGRVPLPPYIRRDEGHQREPYDSERYQTVYARHDGSCAAPTAGLHFTKKTLEELQRRGVSLEYITLHVGPGTFRPVKVADIRDHVMHEERFEVDAGTSAGILAARKSGKRIVAVGTTVCRTLETMAGRGLLGCATSGETDLFIYPGYDFQVVGAMLTNFHLPRSTLLMLVSAFAGRGLVLEAYREAVRLRYRFFSYGDAMLII